MIVQPANLPAVQAFQADTRAFAPVPAPAPTAPAPVEASNPAASPTALDQALAAINQALSASNRALEFSVDADVGRTVVKVVDTDTGETVRQFPSDAALAIARNIDSLLQGQLLAREA